LAASKTGQQLSTGRATAGRTHHARYEFYCERCKKEVTLTLSIGARERGNYKCPGCGGKKLEPLMGTFFSKTSRKA
jgi:DNA-directed RNA polymerase subunit RPC12/RpoP